MMNLNKVRGCLRLYWKYRSGILVNGLCVAVNAFWIWYTWPAASTAIINGSSIGGLIVFQLMAPWLIEAQAERDALRWQLKAMDDELLTKLRAVMSEIIADMKARGIIPEETEVSMTEEEPPIPGRLH